MELPHIEEAATGRRASGKRAKSETEQEFSENVEQLYFRWGCDGLSANRASDTIEAPRGENARVSGFAPRMDGS